MQGPSRVQGEAISTPCPLSWPAQMSYAREHLYLATPAWGPRLCTPKKGSREGLPSGAGR